MKPTVLDSIKTQEEDGIFETLINKFSGGA